MMTVMRKAAFFLIFLWLVPSLLYAQSAQDDRRWEEEKRANLRASEGGNGYAEAGKALREPLTQADLDFFDTLYLKKSLTFEDGCRMIVILLGVPEKSAGFDEQYRFLCQSRIIVNDAPEASDPGVALQRGEFALMLVRSLGIRGGIFPRIFGMNGRFALKELSFEGIMAQGSARQPLSGEEAVAALTRAARWLAE